MRWFRKVWGKLKFQKVYYRLFFHKWSSSQIIWLLSFAGSKLCWSKNFLSGLMLYNQTIILLSFLINHSNLKHHNKFCFTREEVVKTLVRFHVPRREEWRPSQAGPCVNFDRKINCLTLALIFGQPNFPKFQHITPISFFCFYPTFLSK